MLKNLKPSRQIIIYLNSTAICLFFNAVWKNKKSNWRIMLFLCTLALLRRCTRAEEVCKFDSRSSQFSVLHVHDYHICRVGMVLWRKSRGENLIVDFTISYMMTSPKHFYLFP